MPTYDYECQGCEHAFEAFQTISEPHLKVCPVCKKRKLVRLIGGGGGILFKGSGFYTTDYRSSEYKSAAKADGPGAASKADGASGKTDAKKNA